MVLTARSTACCSGHKLLLGGNKNLVVDIQNRNDIYLDSDHFMVECCIVVFALAQQKKTRDEAKRYFKPSQEQWVQYNQHKKKLHNSNDVSIQHTCSFFVTAVRAVLRALARALLLPDPGLYVRTLCLVLECRYQGELTIGVGSKIALWSLTRAPYYDLYVCP